MARERKSIFISHAHEDRSIVEALETALNGMLGESVGVTYSSKQGEIAGGRNWLNWIREQILSCDLAIILITPTSQYRPWVLWEAGTVEGAARMRFAAEADSDTRIIPISVAGDSSEFQTFGQKQVVDGLNAHGLASCFKQILSVFAEELAPEQRAQSERAATALAEAAVEGFRAALKDLPAVTNLALIRDWCDRLDRLIERNEYAEAANFVRWGRVTFRGSLSGRIDIGLHRRFGDVFRATKQWSEAKAEYLYALSYSSRDVVILRQLARVCLELREFAEADQYIRTILQYDPSAIESSEEIAAVAARYHADQNDFAAAADVLGAFEGQSAYVINNVAIYRAKASNGLEQSRAEFESLLALLRRSHARDKWSMAMEVNALIALRQPEAALATLAEIRSFRGAVEPTDDQFDSMTKDWEFLASLANPDAPLDWRAALRKT